MSTIDADPGAHDSERDGWLIRRALTGDSRALEALITHHQARVYRIALRITGNTQDAEEVSQQVWVQVWLSLAGFTGSSAFTTWLYRIVVNRATSTVRSSQRRRAQLVRANADPTVSPGPTTAGGESRVLAGERDDAVDRALLSLSPELRAVVVLRHFEDLSYDEIAQALGIPEPTVRGRLARARRALATSLEQWRRP